jgi:hypothetical protein
MGQLYPSELRDSSEWVLSNAQDVLDSVKKWGGWKKIFPNGIPPWLHKLRNYFNVEPRYLRLVDKPVTDHWMREVRSHGQLNDFVGRRTLSDHVYFDEEVEVWYQMAVGGTIYHWGTHVNYPRLEAAYTHVVHDQTEIPIFKLVCPDGTGGSKETIITNPIRDRVRVKVPHGFEWRVRRLSKLGETNRQVSVASIVVTDMKHQGSYNFAETSVVGLEEHKKADVHTHERDPVYIDPPDRFAPLTDRIFNEFVILAAGGTAPKKLQR